MVSCTFFAFNCNCHLICSTDFGGCDTTVPNISGNALFQSDKESNYKHVLFNLEGKVDKDTIYITGGNGFLSCILDHIHHCDILSKIYETSWLQYATNELMKKSKSQCGSGLGRSIYALILKAVYHCGCVQNFLIYNHRALYFVWTIT